MKLLSSSLSFLRRNLLASVALFVALGGTSYAVSDSVIAQKSTTYYACVTQQFGTLNLTTKNARCPAGQRKISFNAQGASGARGAAGPAGAAGADGAAGP